jgi:hypothetical protein
MDRRIGDEQVMMDEPLEERFDRVRLPVTATPLQTTPIHSAR